MNLAQAEILAARAHRDQVDKIGDPYIRHVRAVAEGLAPFPVEVQIAGYLHDVVEDTDLTLEDLLRFGVPGRSVRTIDAVTRQPGMSKDEQIQRVIDGGWAAVLVKIADNAHNSHPGRAQFLGHTERDRLEKKYSRARKKLWAAAHLDDIRLILEIVNPALLVELAQFRKTREPESEWEGVLGYRAMNDGKPGTSMVREGSVVRARGQMRRGM